MSARAFDVLVVGGGLTGLAFAALLRLATAAARPSLAIGVLEAGAPPAGEWPAATGLRVLALSPASRALLERCRAWSDIPAGRLQPYRRMVAWHHDGEPGGSRSITFDAAAEGLAELGHIGENDVLRRALWRRVADDGGVALLSGTAPASIDLRADGVAIGLAGGGEIAARLVVGADGHDSWLRRSLGVDAGAKPYGQRAIVAHVASAKPHDATAWQRFLPGGPLALLPLADGRSSIVWSCPEAQAASLVAAGEDEFGRALTEASAAVLGDLRLTTPRLAFPLAAGHVSQYTGLRFALIGDAAHRVHPLAGQGVNLGFQDAAALAATLGRHLASRHADPGDPVALRRFERGRRSANLPVLAAMDALHHLFTSRLPGVAAAAGIGLGAADRLAPLKNLLAARATGAPYIE